MNFIKFNTIAPTWMLSLPLTSENWQKYLKFKVDSWFFSSVLLWDLQIFAKLLLIWWSSDCRQNLPLICCQITTRLLPGILPDYYQICRQIRHQFYFQITTRFFAKFVMYSWFWLRVAPDTQLKNLDNWSFEKLKSLSNRAPYGYSKPYIINWYK